ncbi:MAG: FAD-dependent oxidoreductase [Campylobacterota bacterium]|nr:FAD-dependent oxidoreductase [Campylobacterota bacterium]
MTDILIIGSGGAGLTAALEAKKHTNNVTVVSKTYPTASQTSQAQGGINGVLGNNDDTIQNHINDTLKSAHKIGDKETIEYMCQNSCNTIKWLDDIGVPFSRDKDNNIAVRSLGGASHKRACYSSDYTGLKILHTLYDNCINDGIEFINEYMLLNFIVEDNMAKGITALNIETSEVKQILAKSVIVASGGYAALYNNYTTNSTATTGDCVYAALKAGCELANMEYIQFHPTALKDSCVLISESARGEGGYLVTKDGERFVDELLPRDVVARAIYKKIQDKQEVYLDLRHLGIKKIKETMPQEYDLALQFSNLKLDQDLIPIMPAAHYTMGGIKTDINGATNIKNLYAIGESSSNGVHGANRLGGNSLLEIITFGKRAAEAVCEQIQNIEQIENKEYQIFKDDREFIDKLFELPNEINFYDTKNSLGKLFYENVGLYRDQENLETAKEQIKVYISQLKNMGIDDKSKIYNTNLKEFLEVFNLLHLGEAVILSALERKESRGAHYRTDYKNEDSKYEKPTVIKNKESSIKVELI